MGLCGCTRAEFIKYTLSRKGEHETIKEECTDTVE